MAEVFDGRRLVNHIDIVKKKWQKGYTFYMFDDLQTLYVLQHVYVRDSIREVLRTCSTRCQARTGRIDVNDACCICTDEYESRQYVRKLQCGHIFHGRCVDQWFRQSDHVNCPVCRRDFTSEAMTPKLRRPSPEELERLTTTQPVVHAIITSDTDVGMYTVEDALKRMTSGGDGDEPQPEGDQQEGEADVQPPVGLSEH